MTHDDESFRDNFRELLANLHVTWDIVKNMETRFHLGGTGFGERLPLSFMLFLTSAVDTAKNLAFFPFAWIFRANDWEMPFINSDLTPPLFLAASRGLITVKRWQETYEDWIFDGEELRFNDIVRDPSHIKLLIHATDIKNGRPFTFDEWTFGCLGVSKEGFQEFSIALAAASSSALPILFEPLKLNSYLEENFEDFRRTDTISPTCPRIIQDLTETRTLELLDGGIQENLGLAGLVRTIFREKAEGLQSKETKNFIIIVNSAAPAVDPFFSIGTDSSTMANNIDQSIDTLQREKTDLARAIYQKPLNNFGFGSLEINFSDIKNDPDLVKQIWNQLKNKNAPEDFNETLNYIDSYSEFENRFRKDLERIGMRPTQNDIDTLIAAGRSISLRKMDEIIDKLANFSKRKFVIDCDQIINATKFDCWPNVFEEVPYILDRPLGVILTVFSDATEKFIKKTTINRIDKLREIQKQGLKLKRDLEVSEKANKVKAVFKEDIRKELEYYSLLEGLKNPLQGITQESHQEAHEHNEISSNLKNFTKLIEEVKDQKTKNIVGSLMKLFEVGDTLFDDSLKAAQDHLENKDNKEKMYLKGQILPAIDILITEKESKDCNFYFNNPKSETYFSFENAKSETLKVKLREQVIICYMAEYLLKKITEGRAKEEFFSNNHLVFYYAAFLANFLDRKEEVFYNLYTGLHAFPEAETLHSQLGFMGFLIDENAEKVIRHQSKAIEITANKQRQLDSLQFRTHDVEDLERIGKLKEYYQYLENWYKRQLAEYLAVIPGYSGLENSEKDNEEDYKKMGVRFAQEIYNKHKKDAEAPLDKTLQKIQEPIPGLMHHEILYPLALHNLVSFARLECPDRREGIAKSRENLSNSVKLLLRSLKILNKNNDYFKKISDNGNLKGQKDEFNKEVEVFIEDPLKLDEKSFRKLVGSIFPTESLGQFEGNWDQLQGALKINWKEFKDGDLIEIAGRVDRFEMKLDEIYGIRKEEVRAWVIRWLEKEWIERVSNNLSQDRNPDKKNGLRDFIVLLFDLKYLEFFLRYADELECLGGWMPKDISPEDVAKNR